MPYKSKADQKLWLKKAIRNGYGKWLYQKRKRVYQDAAEFKEALLAIGVAGDSEAAQIANDALDASVERWASLGPAPGMNQPPAHPDDSLLATLEKLELETSRK